MLVSIGKNIFRRFGMDGDALMDNTQNGSWLQWRRWSHTVIRSSSFEASLSHHKFARVSHAELLRKSVTARSATLLKRAQRKFFRFGKALTTHIVSKNGPVTRRSSKGLLEDSHISELDYFGCFDGEMKIISRKGILE